jgi:flavin reductase (DIM6/NTAB) family NADH-FMN oxidoreductase RutF
MLPLSASIHDERELRRIFSCFASGVTAVCGLDADGRPQGMAATSFTSVSLVPPLVSVCIANASRTWQRLRHLPSLGISVLSEDQQATGRTLAAADGDRFAGITWQHTETGAVVIGDAVSWLECTVHQELPAGDHTIILLRVSAMAGEPERAPLVFHGSRFKALAATTVP